MEQTIFHTKKTKSNLNDFVAVSKGFLDDNKLSLKAKGILAFLLSKPPEWEESANAIKEYGSDGMAAVASGLKELEQLGYLRRKHKRSKGKFLSVQYYITDRLYDPIIKEENKTTYSYYLNKGKTSLSKDALDKMIIVINEYGVDKFKKLLCTKSYKTFLKTRYWQIIRYNINIREKHTCEICKCKPKDKRFKFNVHHKIYDNHGMEAHNLQDLQLLCSNCHAKIHDK